MKEATKSDNFKQLFRADACVAQDNLQRTWSQFFVKRNSDRKASWFSFIAQAYMTAFLSGYLVSKLPQHTNKILSRKDRELGLIDSQQHCRSGRC